MRGRGLPLRPGEDGEALPFGRGREPLRRLARRTARGPGALVRLVPRGDPRGGRERRPAPGRGRPRAVRGLAAVGGARARRGRPDARGRHRRARRERRLRPAPPRGPAGEPARARRLPRGPGRPAGVGGGGGGGRGDRAHRVRASRCSGLGRGRAPDPAPDLGPAPGGRGRPPPGRPEGRRPGGGPPTHPRDPGGRRRPRPPRVDADERRARRLGPRGAGGGRGPRGSWTSSARAWPATSTSTTARSSSRRRTAADRSR
jgi:hypothetical protein